MSEAAEEFDRTGIYRPSDSSFVFVDPVRLLNCSYSSHQISPSAYYSRFFQQQQPRPTSTSRKRERVTKTKSETRSPTLSEAESRALLRHQEVRPLLMKAHQSFLQATDLLSILPTLRNITLSTAAAASSDNLNAVEVEVEQFFVELGKTCQAPLFDITLNFQSNHVQTSNNGLVMPPDRKVLPLFNSLVANDTTDDLEVEFHNQNSDSGFNLIVIDPPWENGSARQKLKYPTMPNKYFLTLPIKKLAHAEGALVALWVTNREKLRSFVERELFDKWEVKHVATYYWLKVKADGSLVSELDLFLATAMDMYMLVGSPIQKTAFNYIRDNVVISIPGDYSRKPPLAAITEAINLKLSEGQEPWLTSVNNQLGRQHWEYDPSLGTPEEIAQIDELRRVFHKNRFKKKHSSDLIMRLQFEKNKLSQEGGQVEEEDELKRSLRKGLRFFSNLQAEEGFWPQDYGGPLFLLPGLIIALYATKSLKVALSKEHIKEIIRYLYNHQNEDGGWGLHIEGQSAMFGTALNYVTLRLLGEGLNKEMLQAQKWILDRGGAVCVPSWGKLWLSVLGVYEWSGVNPLPPELWLLPYSLPFHPGRMWCHARMVYLPMSYLYGKRFVMPINDLILSLRQELYATDYECIDWDSSRSSCAKEDLYYPHPAIQDILWAGLHKIGEPILKLWPFSKLRQRALRVVKQHFEYEDASTNYICLAPVNKVLNMVCCGIDDPNSEAFSRHLARVKDYLWIAEDGMKMNGYNGSQHWDAAFAVLAILSTNMSDEYEMMLKKLHDFIKNSQIRRDSSEDPSQWFRHGSKGGWTFSTLDQNWMVTDCTALGLETCVELSRLTSATAGKGIEVEKLYDTVNLLLSLQNLEGGFASFELTRSYAWIEMLNPAETFGDIMIDYQYPEISSAVIQGLTSFKKVYPEYRKKEIEACIARAANFIEKVQLPDGSWYGGWGVCFTNATWYATKGLVAAGRTYQTSSSIKGACNFLLSKQLEAGGWGESYLSCTNKVYTNLEGNRPHLVNTAWAMLALIAAGIANIDPTPLHKAAKVLVQAQFDNGDFPQQEISRVFNRNCMISYSAYRNIFPIWALGE